ncbi:MAG: translation initiation factor IF-6 [Candidatus Aenigmarchaeota archaeon]|nr:translation initiation factor IF-6 [Candidatus Aenigmarchaeota archaeon]
MSEILRTNFNGDPNLGLYGFATDKYCLLGLQMGKVGKALGVPMHMCKILNMDMAGLFVAGNSQGIIISDYVNDYNSMQLKQLFDKILVLNTNYTALGNLIMMNDHGVIISPFIKKFRKTISNFFNLPCEAATISKQKIVGNLGFATNKGCLLHPKVKKSEMEIIERVLSVKSDIGTVTFGSSYPGAGLIANSNGFVVSDRTSGPELGRITEALGFI